MRFSRTDLAPVLVIIVGGAMGLSSAFRAVNNGRSSGPQASAAVYLLPDIRLPDAKLNIDAAQVAEYDKPVPVISPDGRWIAFVSRESGSDEVYVRSFPDLTAGQWQVSTNGGITVAWAQSGRELFYLDEHRALIAAEFDEDSPGSPVGEVEMLFTLPNGGGIVNVRPR